MSIEATASTMAEPPRPAMLLFMGGNPDHAITSFQRFFPSSVHIVTSDRYSEKYEEMLTEWSVNSGFRKGLVCFVDDLFEPSAVNSLITASFQALRNEFEQKGDSEETVPLLVGITGGTMHMAVTGTYLAQLVGGTVFYVLRPREGQPIRPARDVVVFPELRSLKTALTTVVPDVHYLMGEGEGQVEELLEASNINDYFLEQLESAGLIKVDEGSWQLTDLGYHSFNFISKSRMWDDFHMILEQMLSDSQSDSEDSAMHG